MSTEHALGASNIFWQVDTSVATHEEARKEANLPLPLVCSAKAAGNCSECAHNVVQKPYTNTVFRSAQHDQRASMCAVYCQLGIN